MSDCSDLVLHYSGKDLGSDGATPPTYTADSGTVSTFVDAALTEANDYWIGAKVEWLTGPNAGLFSCVQDFDSATDTITLDESLPSAVAAGHTYKLYLGLGGYRSSVEVTHLVAAAPVNVTGVVIARVGGYNDIGDGTLTYVFNGGGGARALRWTAPSGAIGPEVVVGGGNGDYVLKDTDISKWIEVTVTIAALPGSDQSDTIALTQPRHRVLGPLVGAENTAGKTRYELIVPRNRHATNTLFAITAYLRTGKWIDSTGAKQTAANTTVGAAGYANSGAVTVPCADASTWPTRGHVFNQTSAEILQYNSRSGNNLTVAASGRAIRGTSIAAGTLADVLILLPNVDIGLEAPGGGNVFQTVASETTAPAGGVTFSHPITAGAGLVIGDKAAGAVHGVWYREQITAAGVPQLNALELIEFYVEVA